MYLTPNGGYSTIILVAFFSIQGFNSFTQPWVNNEVLNYAKGNIVGISDSLNYANTFPKIQKLSLNNAEISMNMLIGRQPYSFFSQNLINGNIEGNGSVSIYNVPFTCHALYSTADDVYKTNQFTWSFDQQKFIEKLKSQVLGHLDIGNNIPGVSAESDDIPFERIIKLEKHKNEINLEDSIRLLNSKEILLIEIEEEINLLVRVQNKFHESIDSSESLQSKIDQLNTKRDKMLEQRNKLSKLVRYASLNKNLIADLKTDLKTDLLYQPDLSLYQQLKNDQVSKDGIIALSRHYGLLDDVTKFISHIDEFQIGIVAPRINSLSTSGLPIRGINQSFVFNGIIAGLLVGRVSPFLLIDSTLSRKIMSGYIKLGKTLENQTNLSVLFGYDEPVNKEFIPRKLNEPNNIVYALGTNQSFNKGKVTISFETALSTDHGDKVLNESKNNQPTTSGILTNILFGNNDDMTNVGFAAKIKSRFSFNQNKTTLKINGSWINPYFNSFGIYFVNQDNLKYDFQFDQSVYKRKIRLKAWIKREEANLFQFSKSINTTTTCGVSASVKLRRLPVLTISYLPVNRINQNERFQYSAWSSNLSYTKSTNTASLSSLTSVQLNNSKSDYLPDSLIYSGRLFSQVLRYSISKYHLLVSYSNMKYSKQKSSGFIDIASGFSSDKIHLEAGFRAEMLNEIKLGYYINGQFILNDLISLMVKSEKFPEIYNPYFDLLIHEGWYSTIGLKLKIN